MSEQFKGSPELLSRVESSIADRVTRIYLLATASQEGRAKAKCSLLLASAWAVLSGAGVAFVPHEELRVFLVLVVQTVGTLWFGLSVISARRITTADSILRRFRDLEVRFTNNDQTLQGQNNSKAEQKRLELRISFSAELGALQTAAEGLDADAMQEILNLTTGVARGSREGGTSS